MLDAPSLPATRARLAAVLRAAKDVVSVDTVARTLTLDRPAAAKLLARWREQGWLRRIGHGLYVPVPLEREVARLIPYAEQYGNGAVFKRLGFLAETRLHDAALAAACRARSTQGYAQLDPDLSCSRLVTAWRLWVPDRWKQEAAHRILRGRPARAAIRRTPIIPILHQRDPVRYFNSLLRAARV